ncbi:MAG: bifunctional diguanylate cyclase/phosphodiesterase [Paracoccaceae bacterium]|nr:bifunctional diguanylate cyclase/phosphodiesterase [Salipiger profundus]
MAPITALDPDGMTRHSFPEELERLVSDALDAMRSQDLHAALFLPLPEPGKPRVMIGDTDTRLRRQTLQLVDFTADPTCGDPLLIMHTPQETLVARRIEDSAGNLRGALGLRLAPTPDPAASVRAERAARLLGNTLMQWDDLLTLEEELSGEVRQSHALSRQADRDALTALLNNRAFQRRCRHRLGTDIRHHALLLLDLDNFKTVNDVYGHPFGDQYLQTVARALIRALPSKSLLGRLGGDEFAALIALPDGDSATVDRLMRDCFTGIEDGAADLGKPDLGRVSIGCAITTEKLRDVSRLLHRADAALYASKRADHRKGAVYTPETHQNFSARLMRPRFLQALEERRIQPFFQPIRSLLSGRIAGYEVLVRWIDPEKGVLEPEAFSLALSTPELAEKLSRRIIGEALSHFAGLPQRDPLWLTLNVGAGDLLRSELVEDLDRALERHGLDWEHIVIEVTETTMLGEVQGPIFRTLANLRHRGARVALDDFGTGYAGLAHLRSWPVDMLKLDRCFIQDIASSPRDSAFVSALLQLTTAFGIDLIVEGVEDEETASLLRKLGCDLVQGYHYGSPGPLGAD